MNPQINENNALTGFGAHGAQEVNELQKALSLGSEYASTLPGSMTGGAALAVEDLDRTLKLVTFGMEHLKLWKDIVKEKQTQTVHEFNIQNSYGQEVSPFFQMGSTPQGTDASYNREIAIVKYLGTYGQVQHNLTLIQAAHGPVVAREVKNKTVELLSRNERAMFEADSAINPLEYDGIEATMKGKEQLAKFKSTAFAGFNAAGTSDTVIIDKRGDVLDEDTCEIACLTALNNFGMPMDAYTSTDIHSRFSRAFYQKERVRPGDRTAAGYLVPEFVGSLNFRFKPNLFNRPRRSPLGTAVSATAAPTIANPLTPADGASQFATSDAGAYSYKISSIYKDGETLPSASSGSVAVAAGAKTTIEITYTGTPLYFNVFRSPKDAITANWEFIGRVAPTTSGGTYNIDYNANLPGLGSMYLLMHDPDTLVWRQLGSMIKYDLAVTDTSYRWLQLLYGMVVMQAVRKHCMVKNIGITSA